MLSGGGAGATGAPAAQAKRPAAPLVIAAIGIVFGDIGTSPLYTLRECFTGPHGLPLTPDNVLGVLSVIFWALMIIVTLKYVTLIMRADNRGEGGIMALTALVSRGLDDRQARWWLVGLGIFGAAMFYGDGMITPAISVLVRGRGARGRDAGLEAFVIPRDRWRSCSRCSRSSVTAPATVGGLFGPLMCLWFATIAVMGAAAIWQDPRVLMALLPVRTHFRF